jgi:sulfatase maturation enzyme AslB (radical SAM superfamily)
MIQSDQTYKVCCNGREFPNLTTHTTTATQAFYSTEFESVRTNLKNGIKDSHCDKCWKLEEQGAESLRLQNLTHDEYNTEEITQSPRIEQIFVGLGNTCNLKCRTCGPGESSIWVKEIEKFEGIKHPIYLEPDTSDFFKSFKQDVMPHLKEIHFTGGEPTLLKSTNKILELLDPSVQINMNANCTIKLSDALNKFENVEIFASIDGIGDRFNYIRHPGNWEEVYNNLKTMTSNVDVIIACTISVYNIFYIDEVENLANELGIPFYAHILYDPTYLSVHVLPIEVRQEIIKKLSANPSIQKDKVIAHLNEQTYLNWDTFVSEVNKRDKIRGEDFKTTFPEFYDLLVKYGKTV